MEMNGAWHRESVPTVHEITHVYCPDCYETLMDEIDRFAVQRLRNSVTVIVNAPQLQGA